MQSRAHQNLPFFSVWEISVLLNLTQFILSPRISIVSEQSSLEQAYLKVHRLSKYCFFSELIVSFHLYHSDSHFPARETGFSILQGGKEAGRVCWTRRKGTGKNQWVNDCSIFFCLTAMDHTTGNVVVINLVHQAKLLLLGIVEVLAFLFPFSWIF